MNPEENLVFNAERLGDALHELGCIARDAGRVIDIAVYGGSCLMLVSNFRLATADVDAVAMEDQSFLDEAALDVAERRGWPRDWLNDGVRTYLSPLLEGYEQHTLFRAYPNEQTPGLRVFVPSAEYILAMKLMALRLDLGGGSNDLEDIFNLLQIAGLKDKSEIIGFAARFYPEARVSGKLALAIDYIWTEYRKRQKDAAHEPPEYLGRSGPQS
ncbi:MAG TPA: hypothetical protein VK446_14740 [Methylocystis sp.]|nr:hypothetical protein [Methylocystis sp.]